jgi:predicted phosphodiesterase
MTDKNSISWLHLSDWHQKGRTLGHDRKVVRDALVRDIRNRHRISDRLKEVEFAIFSGDAAWEGLEVEYNAAHTYLFKPVLEAAGLSSGKNVFVVPGNHDLERSKLAEIPKNVEEELEVPEKVPGVFDTGWKRTVVLEPFQNYRNFVAEHFIGYPRKRKGASDPIFCTVHKFKAKGRIVGVLGLNSCWLSARQKNTRGEVNDYGHLMLGEPQVYDGLGQIEDADIRIVVMHHPLSWFRENDRIRAEERISRGCHFLLHGHEHLPRVNVLESTGGDMITIPAGASYERRMAPDPRYTNAYNFVALDLNTGEGTVFLRRWNDRKGEWVADSDLWPDGRFRFVIPNWYGPLTTDQREALHEVRLKSFSQAKKRFFDKFEVEICHELRDIGNTKLLVNEVAHKIVVAPGDASPFRVTSFANKRVLALIEGGGRNIKPYELDYFRLNGRDRRPAVADDLRFTYDVTLPSERTTIEYRFKLLEATEGVYDTVLGHFARNFKLTFQREKSLSYELAALGGLRARRPDDGGPIKNTMVIECDGLCYPNQGYTMHWYPSPKSGR